MFTEIFTEMKINHKDMKVSYEALGAGDASIMSDGANYYYWNREDSEYVKVTDIKSIEKDKKRYRKV